MVSGISWRHVAFAIVLFFFSCGNTSVDDDTADTSADSTAATTDTMAAETRTDIKDLIQDSADSTTLLLSKEQKAALSGNPQKIAQYRADIAEHLPKPHNWVNDFDDLFTQKQEDELNSLISGFEKESGMQIAVISLDTFCISKNDMSNAGLKIYNAWGLGTKEKNDGLLITIISGYGYMRMNTGSGTQQILNDGAADSIMQASFFPSFKDGNFYKGTRTGLNALISYLKPNTDKIK